MLADGWRSAGSGGGTGSSWRAQVQYSTNPQARGAPPSRVYCGSDPRMFFAAGRGLDRPPPHIRNLLSLTRVAAPSVAKIPRLKGRIGGDLFSFRAFIFGAAAGACALDAWHVSWSWSARALSIVFDVLVLVGLRGSGSPVAVYVFTHRVWSVYNVLVVSFYGG